MSRTSKKNSARLFLIAVAMVAIVCVGSLTWAFTTRNNGESKDKEQSEQVEPSTQASSTPGALDYLPKELRTIAVDVSKVDRTDPEAVALRAAEIMTTWYPGSDYNRSVADQRAAGLVAARRAEAIGLPERPATGEPWNTWASRNGWTVPSVKIRGSQDINEDYTGKTSKNTTQVEVASAWKWAAEGYNSELSDRQYIFYFSLTKHPERGWEIEDWTTDVLDY